MKCKHCGVNIRAVNDGLEPRFVHVIEVPGTSRTSASYYHCRLTVAELAEPVTLSTDPDEWCPSKHVHHPGCYK